LLVLVGNGITTKAFEGATKCKLPIALLPYKMRQFERLTEYIVSLTAYDIYKFRISR